MIVLLWLPNISGITDLFFFSFLNKTYKIIGCASTPDYCLESTQFKMLAKGNKKIVFVTCLILHLLS